jgi:hypothetical protein
MRHNFFPEPSQKFIKGRSKEMKQLYSDDEIKFQQQISTSLKRIGNFITHTLTIHAVLFNALLFQFLL